MVSIPSLSLFMSDGVSSWNRLLAFCEFSFGLQQLLLGVARLQVEPTLNVRELDHSCQFL